MALTGRVWLAIGVMLAVSLLGAAMGKAQLASLLAPEEEALIYDGDVKTDSGGISLTAWGSGKAESVNDRTYIGPDVLKVTSQGPYQGIVLHFARPVQLADYLAARESYLDLRILPAQVPKPKEQLPSTREGLRGRTGTGTTGTGSGLSSRRGGGTSGGQSSRRGGGGMGGRRGGGGMGRVDPGVAGENGLQVVLTGGMMGGGRGGRRGGGGTGAGGGATRGRAGRAGTQPGATRQPTTQPRPSATGPQVPAFTLTRLRITLFTDAGTLTAYSPPVGTMAKDKRGWVPVMIPLSEFAGVEKATTLQAVGMYADQADGFYLGRVRLVTDKAPVQLSVKAEPSITVTGRIIEFSTEVAGGAIEPEFSWDFDDADGIQKQAVGPKVKFIYKKASDYLVTCTISDRGGVRDPFAQTVGVHVEAGATASE